MRCLSKLLSQFSWFHSNTSTTHQDRLKKQRFIGRKHIRMHSEREIDLIIRADATHFQSPSTFSSRHFLRFIRSCVCVIVGARYRVCVRVCGLVGKSKSCYSLWCLSCQCVGCQLCILFFASSLLKIWIFQASLLLVQNQRHNRLSSLSRVIRGVMYGGWDELCCAKANETFPFH